MPITIADIEAAVALPGEAALSDFDLNPEVRARELDIHARRPAAVLCALHPREDALHVVLTVRADHLAQHAGQVAFPGGKIDESDPSPEHTALREAEEEIGLPRTAVRVIGQVDPYLTSTGYHVIPIIGVIERSWRPRPDPSEVEHVFEPPLDFLMDRRNRRRHRRDRDGNRRHYYAMPWNGHYIWGATAGMLKGLADRLDVVRAR